MQLSFGKKLKRLRQNKEISQKELGKILNTTQSSIGRYEKDQGVPDLDTLRLIADYFKVSIDSLIDRDTSKDNSNELRETIEESIKELEDEETLLFMKNGEIDEETTRLLKVAIKNGVKVVNELKKKD
ncbi:helix-turn-helix domain-containing protein [Brochothrix thermosphacta]|uniref:ICEBs1 mobile element: transcriptional regulator (Xre family) n=1 Tax=Brochothrix thermosphacta TaxID=2756 RepID=A0A2X0QG48_BROTH|nr:helix-turn-helix transcriptional regulator [Brochothrix thermosphacta]SPP27223.1 ICEBs1 mobile element: transcriptional regulator (Xre family) [Brochothrix thermosphacta]SPP28894.1 ICEBs1 mobile element: transcriptional regulator (Xre family) [Brochothrix thermosphacta]